MSRRDRIAESQVEGAAEVVDAGKPERASLTAAEWWAKWEDEYTRGLHPLAQIKPEDRPPAEISDHFYGALQDWLQENAPALTLEACRKHPAPLRRGFTLIPGDGAQIWTCGDDDAVPTYLHTSDYKDDDE